MSNFNQTIQLLHTFLKPELNTLKTTMGNCLTSEVHLINEVRTFIDNHPGKLLRPILTILSAKVFNYNGPHHINLGAAVECIHVATLLHDDVIDNSQLRHHSPTINLIWNNTTAILMGDYLFSKAFQLMVCTERLEVLQILSSSSAVISQGELKQFENITNVDMSLEDYFSIITAKTACLFQAATHIGALIATDDSNKIELLKNIGLNFGIAYQILDDINDYCFQEQKIGKNPGDDLREGKVTLPLIIAISQMTREEKNQVEIILQRKAGEPEDITTVISILNKYNALQLAKDYATQYINKTLNYLNNLGRVDISKDYLSMLVKSLRSI